MKMNWHYLILAMFFICTVPLIGMDADAFQAGNKELTLGGSGSSDESLDGTILSMEASLGSFLTDNFEVLIRQGISYADVPGDDDWNGSTRLGIDYHFNLDPVYPLIGASIGYLYGDTVKEQFIAGPQAGLKYFANPTTFVFGVVEYEFLFKDADEAEENYDDGRFVYNFGIGFIW